LVHPHDYNEARLVLIGRNKTRWLSFRVKLVGRVVSYECRISQCLGSGKAPSGKFRPPLSEMEVAGEENRANLRANLKGGRQKIIPGAKTVRAAGQ
jgi:hypothetical protein